MDKIGVREETALITLRSAKELMEKIEKAIENGETKAIVNIDERANKVHDSIFSLYGDIVLLSGKT